MAESDADRLGDLGRRAKKAAAEATAQQQRAQQDMDESARLGRRSRILRTFVHRFEQDPDHLPLHCAWCDRVEVEGVFVQLDAFLRTGLPERLRERSTHGICPDCLQREQEKANQARAAHHDEGGSSS